MPTVETHRPAPGNALRPAAQGDAAAGQGGRRCRPRWCSTPSRTGPAALAAGAAAAGSRPGAGEPLDRLLGAGHGEQARGRPKTRRPDSQAAGRLPDRAQGTSGRDSFAPGGGREGRAADRPACRRGLPPGAQPQGGRPDRGAAAGRDLAHRLETLFARVREGDLAARPGRSSACIHLGLDAIEDCAACLAENKPPTRNPSRCWTPSTRLLGSVAGAAATAVEKARRARSRRADAAAAASHPVETVRVSADQPGPAAPLDRAAADREPAAEPGGPAN